MRLVFSTLFAVVLAGAAFAQTSTPQYVRPEADQRFRRYLKDMFGPGAIAKTVVGAGFATATNSPEEWEPNGRGFGRRVASNFGRNAISATTRYGLDEAFKLDSRYYRSEKKGFGRRLGHAMASTVTARRRDGSRTIGFPRIAGTYTAHVVAAETWYPPRYGWKDGMRSGTMSLGMNALWNVITEFVRR